MSVDLQEVLNFKLTGQDSCGENAARRPHFLIHQIYRNEVNS